MASGHFTEAEAKAKVGRRVQIKPGDPFPVLRSGLSGIVQAPHKIGEGEWGLEIKWDPFFVPRAHDTGSDCIQGRSDGFTKDEYARYLKELPSPQVRQSSQPAATTA